MLWYRINRVIGQGVCGVTYLAEDISMHGQVAIKEFFPTQYCARDGGSPALKPLSPSLASGFSWSLERFRSDAFTLARFEHPNIVRILNIFEENGTAYMVMPYEHGVKFSDVLKRRHTLKEDELNAFTKPLLDGLETIHAAGFAHCDIRPSNIRIREDGTPVLLDFGTLRQAVIRDTKNWSRLAHGYVPIEQYTRKDESCEPSADIYGMGATLYRAVTGEVPLSAVDRRKAVMNGQGDIMPSSERLPGVYSRRFLAAIDHALAIRAQDRPQDIAGWRQEFGYGVTTGADTASRIPEAEEDAEAEVAPAFSVGKITDWLVEASHPGRYRIALQEAHQKRLQARGETPATTDLPRISPRGPEVEIMSSAESDSRYRRRLGYFARAGGLSVAASGVLVTGLLFFMKPELLQQLGSITASGWSDSGLVANASDSGAMNNPEKEEQTQPATDADESGQAHEDPRNEVADKESLSEAAAAEREMKAQAARAEAERERRQRQKEINELLAAAKEDIVARRLTTPDGNNAYAKYRSVLEKDPENLAAFAGLQKILDIYLDIATNAMDKGDFSHAEVMLRRAAQVDPQSSRLLEAHNKLEQRQSQSGSAGSTVDANTASSAPPKASPVNY